MLNTQALALIDEQIEHWDLAAINYAGLLAVESKLFQFDSFQFSVQFNPKRLLSSAAKVDPKSIQERPCFLCEANLPPQQNSISVGQFLVLLNPFPIFAKHLTIVSKLHTNQRIDGRIGDLLNFAEQLSDFTIFYNGPKCGASAPDHFHFQAGNKGLMPIEKELDHYPFKEILIQDQNCLMYSLEHYIRKALVIESTDKTKIEKTFTNLLHSLELTLEQEPEPMLNILAWYADNKFTLVVFPRAKHRPDQFYEQGDAQIVLSPASVDFGGLLICPRAEDFHKMDKQLIQNLIEQVSLNPTDWAKIKQNILIVK